MDALTHFLEALNTMSPLAVIALLGTVIFLMVKGKQDADAQYETMTGNHLHELPQIASDIRAMSETLQRIEVRMSSDFAELKGKLDNK
jgi:hypothetical protein